MGCLRTMLLKLKVRVNHLGGGEGAVSLARLQLLMQQL